MNKIIVIITFVSSCAVLTQSLPILDDVAHGKTKDLLRGLSTTCLGLNQFIVENWAIQLNYSRLNVLMYEINQFRVYSYPDAPSQIRDSPYFNPQVPLIIFLHGWSQYPDHPMIKLVAHNYFEKTQCNFLSFNTSSYTGGEYLDAVRSVPKMAIALFEFLTYMRSRGILSQNIHLIGFSLGAQISANAARMYKAAYNSSIYRITALDPASPCFMTSNLSITQNDASYVDVIHTSIASVTDKMMGHADYYVNGKVGYQPGCPPMDIKCCHSRSVYLYAGSLQFTDQFIAKKCTDSNSSQLVCQKDQVSYLGYGSSPFTRGVYSMNTFPEYPYAMGEDGI